MLLGMRNRYGRASARTGMGVLGFFRIHEGFLADDHRRQHAPDRVKLGRIYERIGADVEERAEGGDTVAGAGQRQREAEVDQQKVDVVRDVGNDVERAD